MAEATRREKRMMADGSRTSDWARVEDWGGAAAARERIIYMRESERNVSEIASHRKEPPRRQGTVMGNASAGR
jgi:hypothetical protein